MLPCFPASRGLLDDVQFHDCIQCLDDEPIPYFQQYSTRECPQRPSVPLIELIDQTPTGRLPQDDDHQLLDLLSPAEGRGNMNVGFVKKI